MEELREYTDSILRRLSHVEKRLEEIQDQIDSLYEELEDKAIVE